MTTISRRHALRTAAALVALPSLSGLLAACSQLGLANALTLEGGARVSRDLRFRDGPRGTLDLCEPEGGAAPGAPLVVLFYGGGWQGGAKEEYAWAARSLVAESRFAVAVPDYRIHPEARWPAFVEDGAAAVSFLRDGPGAGRPMVLLGHSAGAFIAAALACDPRWLGEAGRRALSGLVGVAGPYDFAPDEPAYVAIFRDAPGGRAVAAPSDAALRGAPPMLLLHGTGDRTVGLHHSRDLAARARAAGVPARLVEYPGVGHVAIMADLAHAARRWGLSRAPVLDEVVAFARDPAGRAALPVAA